MKRERFREMEKVIQEEMGIMLHERMQEILKQSKTESDIWSNIPDILQALVNNRTGKLVIAYLRSSIVTESHGFYFAFYKDELFVEENPDKLMLKFPTLFANAGEDIKKLEKVLRKKYVRIFSSDIEEIRRTYLLRIYEDCEEIFRYMLKECSKAEGTPVYYGEYMGEKVTQIGMI